MEDVEKTGETDERAEETTGPADDAGALFAEESICGKEKETEDGGVSDEDDEEGDTRELCSDVAALTLSREDAERGSNDSDREELPTLSEDAKGLLRADRGASKLTSGSVQHLA